MPAPHPQSFAITAEKKPLRRHCLSQLPRIVVATFAYTAVVGCGPWPPIAETRSQVDGLPITTETVRARRLSDADIPALARLRQLKNLDCSGGMAVQDAAITNSGLEALAKLDLPRLDCLDVGFNTNITNAGLVHVARIETLSMLLLPACPKITGEGLAPLLGMKGLVYLDLRGCQGITDDGLQTLTPKRDLKELHLGGCRNVTPQGIARLQASLPNLRIVKDDKQWNESWREYEK